MKGILVDCFQRFIETTVYPCGWSMLLQKTPLAFDRSAGLAPVVV